MRLLEPDGGRILFHDRDLTQIPRGEFRQQRQHLQMVFQDPLSSLNPRKKLATILTDGPAAHGVDRATALVKAGDMLSLVGLHPSAINRFPHEFSGGQRQRINIARALMMEPDVIVADEPVSALDVLVQAQVLELFSALQKRLRLTMVFITHDLRVAAQLCHSVAVMQRGEIVEYGATKDVFSNPQHAYTGNSLPRFPPCSRTLTHETVLFRGPACPSAAAIHGLWPSGQTHRKRGSRHHLGPLTGCLRPDPGTAGGD